MFILECGRAEPVIRNIWNRFISTEVVEYCIPLLGYYNSPASEKSMQDYVLQYFFPVLAQGEKTIHYQTNLESEFSYEMILALEAADENYIDVTTGDVVGEVDVVELIQETTDAQVETDDGFLEQIGLENTKNVSVVKQKQVTYSREKLTDFDYLIQNFYRVDKTTTINSSQLNALEMLEKDMRLTHDATSPQILIYHTHSQEGYMDSVPGDASTSVVGVGDYLTEILQEVYGLNVIHHTGQYDVETRDDAYTLADRIDTVLNPGTSPRKVKV